MKWLVVLVVSVVGIAGAALPSVSGAVPFGVGCHAAYALPRGWGGGDAYDAVQVLKRKNMRCSAALLIGAKAYSEPGLKPIYGSQFGGGGFGGPFRVGRFQCFLLNRGSDFRNATCHDGTHSVRFYDHRQYFSIPEAGWSPPARKCGC